MKTSQKKEWSSVLASLLCVPAEIPEARKEVGVLRIGGRGRSVAEEVDAVLENDQISMNDQVYTIVAVEIFDSKRSVAERADLILRCKDCDIKLWLPLKDGNRWLDQFKRLQMELSYDVVPEMNRKISKGQDHGAEATALSDEEIQTIISDLNEIKTSKWREAYDEVTARTYYYHPETGETAWHRPYFETTEKTLPKLEETKQALIDFVEPGQRTPEVIVKVLSTLQKCPIFSKDPDWIALLEPKNARRSLRGLIKTSVDDSLLEKLAYALAEVLDLLENTTVEIESAFCVKAILHTDDLRELPQVFIDRIIEARRVILQKVAPFLNDKELFTKKLKKSMQTIPKKSILSLASYGALPSSKSTARKIMHLFFSARGLGSLSVVQKMAHFSLGIDSAEIARNECMKRLDSQRLTKEILSSLSTSALEDEKVLDSLFETVPIEASRACSLELYIRKAHKVVESYGDPAYVEFVAKAYPTILCPLAAALQSSKLQGLKVLESIFFALDALNPSDTLFAQLRALDDAIGYIFAQVLGLAHRAAIHTPGPCLQVLDWLRSLVIKSTAPATPIGALYVPRPSHLDLPCASLRIAPASVDLTLFGYARLDNLTSSSSPRVWGRPLSPHESSITDVTIATSVDALTELIETGWFLAGTLSSGSVFSLSYSTKPVLLYKRTMVGGLPRKSASSDDDSSITLKQIKALLARFGF